MMRKSITLATLTTVATMLPWNSDLVTSAWAQAVQQGQVLEYQGTQDKTPLPNVVIAAQNAASTQSSADGTFTLQFRTLHAGDDILMRRVERSGYEVMNPEAIQNLRITRQEANQKPIQIVMCSKRRLQELRDGYRSAAVQRYQKQLQLSQQELERLKAEQQIATDAYNQRMDSLESAYEESLLRLENYIDKFARIDLAQLDAAEQQILDLVQAGKFDEAIELYDQQDFPGKLAQSQADRKQLSDARQKVAEAEANQENQIQKLCASIARQCDLLMMAGGEENERKALELLHRTFLADTTDTNFRIAYAMRLQLYSGDNQQAIDLLLGGIPHAKNDMDKGVFYLSAAELFPHMGRYDEAIHYAQLADSVLWPIRDQYKTIMTQAYPDLTKLFISYAPFVEQMDGDFYVKRMRDNWRLDTLSTLSVMKYKELLMALLDYDSKLNQHELSLQDAEQAIQLEEMLMKKCPWACSPCEVYSNASTVFAFEGRHDALTDAARKTADDILARFPKIRSTQGTLALGLAAYTVVENLTGAECYAEAEAFMQQADSIGLMQLMANRYPEVMNFAVGLYKIYGAQVSAAMHPGKEVQGQLNEGLDLLAQDEDYASIVAYLKAYSEAKIAVNKANYAEAERLYQEAMNAVLEGCGNEPDTWDSDNICHCYLGMADCRLAQGDKKQAKNWLKQARKYATFELDRQLIAKRNK